METLEQVNVYLGSFCFFTDCTGRILLFLEKITENARLLSPFCHCPFYLSFLFSYWKSDSVVSTITLAVLPAFLSYSSRTKSVCDVFSHKIWLCCSLFLLIWTMTNLGMCRPQVRWADIFRMVVGGKWTREPKCRDTWRVLQKADKGN